MLNSWLLPDWPDDVLAAAKNFRQGHVLQWPWLAYGAAFQHPTVQPTSSAGTVGHGYVKVDVNDQLVIITSHTCQISEDGSPRPRFPFINVSPIYDILPTLPDASQAGLVKKGRYGYLIPLTHPSLCPDGRLLVADLRIAQSLDKGVLVGLTPTEAFETEEEYLRFSERLAHQVDRPALHPVVQSVLIAPLKKAIKNGNLTGGTIEEIRLQVNPTFGEPERARLVVIASEDTDVEVLAEEMSAWHEDVIGRRSHRPTVLPPLVLAYEDVPYALLRRTVHVPEFNH